MVVHKKIDKSIISVGALVSMIAVFTENGTCSSIKGSDSSECDSKVNVVPRSDFESELV